MPKLLPSKFNTQNLTLNTFRRKRGARLREMIISAICRGLAGLFALPAKFRSHSLAIAPNARILLIKPCCLGDVVYTTPAIAALREAFPKAHLTFAVSKWSRAVVADSTRLNAILDTGVSGSAFNFRQYLALVRKVRSGRYDAAIVFDRSPLLAFLPFLAGIKVRVGIDSRGRGFALNIRTRLEIDSPTRHEAEIYLDIIRAMGISTSAPRTEFFPTEAANLSMRRKLADIGFHFDETGKNLAIIHPGGGHNPDTRVPSKRWPAQRFGEIAGRLLAQGWQVIVIGAEEDKPLVETIIEVAAKPSLTRKLYNAAGKLDIAETGALLQSADLFVGNDTGLTHLATTGKAAVVAIFGPSSPIAYRPYSPKGRAIAPPGAEQNPHLPLAEYQNLAATQGGIEAVTVEKVWDTIEDLRFTPH